MVFALTLAIALLDKRVETLNKIGAECGFSKGDLTVNEKTGFVRIIPKSGSAPSLQQLSCLLPKLKQSGMYTKVGFISEPPTEKK